MQNESEEMQLDVSPPGESSLASDALSDSLMEPFLDEPSSSFHRPEFNFEFSDNSYRFEIFIKILELSGILRHRARRFFS